MGDQKLEKILDLVKEYITEKRDTIIVKPLVTEAPIQWTKHGNTTSL